MTAALATAARICFMMKLIQSISAVSVGHL